MTTLTSLSQDLKTVPIEVETIENVKRFVDKCDSLRNSYNALIKEKEILAKEILETISTIEQLKLEKSVLSQKLTDITIDYQKSNDSRLGLDVQFGVQPTYIEDKFSAKPYAGVGVSWRLFSF